MPDTTRRGRYLAMAAAGAVVSTLLGSGLVAATLDTVTSTDNSFQSGTFATPADLRVASAQNGSCDGVTFGTESSVPAIFGSENVALEPGATTLEKSVCVRNAGGSQGWLHVAFADVVDSEANPSGGCEASESDPTGGNDGTCEAGPGTGELSPVLSTSVAATSCSPPESMLETNTDFGSMASSGAHMGWLQPGMTCLVPIEIGVLEWVSDQQRQAAQTDRVQWDIVFTLADSSPYGQDTTTVPR